MSLTQGGELQLAPADEKPMRWKDRYPYMYSTHFPTNTLQAMYISNLLLRLPIDLMQ